MSVATTEFTSNVTLQAFYDNLDSFAASAGGIEEAARIDFAGSDARPVGRSRSKR